MFDDDEEEDFQQVLTEVLTVEQIKAQQIADAKAKGLEYEGRE
jgi:hypothetical protein